MQSLENSPVTSSCSVKPKARKYKQINSIQSASIFLPFFIPDKKCSCRQHIPIRCANVSFMAFLSQESLGTARVSIQLNWDHNTELCSLNFWSVHVEIPSKHLHIQISTPPPYNLSFKCVSTPWTTPFPPRTSKTFWAAASFVFKHSQCHAAMPLFTDHPHTVPSSSSVRKDRTSWNSFATTDCQEALSQPLEIITGCISQTHTSGSISFLSTFNLGLVGIKEQFKINLLKNWLHWLSNGKRGPSWPRSDNLLGCSCLLRHSDALPSSSGRTIQVIFPQSSQCKVNQFAASHFQPELKSTACWAVGQKHWQISLGAQRAQWPQPSMQPPDKQSFSSEVFYITQNRVFTINKQCLNSLTLLNKIN